MTTSFSKARWRLVVLGVIAGTAFFLARPWVYKALGPVTFEIVASLSRLTEPKPKPTPAPPRLPRPAGQPPSGGWSLGEAHTYPFDGLRLGDVDSGVVYAADRHDVVALTLDGQERWRKALDSRATRVEPPRLFGSSLLVSGGDKVSVLSLDGKVISETAVPGGNETGLLAFANSRFVVRGSGNTVRALSADGRELWARAFEKHRLGGVAMDHEGRTYIAVEGRVLAVDATGRDLWKYGGKDLEYSGPTAYLLAVGPNGVLYGTSAWSIVALQPSDGHVLWQDISGGACAGDGISWHADDVYTACNQTVTAHAADGRARWQVKLGGTSRLLPPVVDESGTVYVAATYLAGSGNGYGALTAVSDASGKTVWTTILERPLTTRPLKGTDGVLYVGGDNRTYAVSPAGQLLWERQVQPRDNGALPVTRLEPTAVGIVGSADRIFMIPVAISTEAPRTFSWRRTWY